MLDEIKVRALKQKKSRAEFWVFLLAITASAFTGFVVHAYFSRFGFADFELQEFWLHVGTSLGGVLNPILAFAAFIALLATIMLQIVELRFTRSELAKSANALENQINLLRKQTFDSLFFRLVTLHNEIIRDLTIESDGKVYKGRDCFAVLLRQLKDQIDAQHAQAPEDPPVVIIDRAYKTLSELAQSEYGHYFRNLLNIVRIIDDRYRAILKSLDDAVDAINEEKAELSILKRLIRWFRAARFKQAEKDELERIEKMRQQMRVERKSYARTIRSQLSTHELMLLYYNCISDIGKRSFKKFVVEYELLDNLKPSLLPFPADEDEARGLYAEGAFGRHVDQEPEPQAS